MKITVRLSRSGLSTSSRFHGTDVQDVETTSMSTRASIKHTLFQRANKLPNRLSKLPIYEMKSIVTNLSLEESNGSKTTFLNTPFFVKNSSIS